MTTEGVDFSYARPGGAALVAAGKQFVVRYVTGASGKALTVAEIADYHAHGLAIVLVFETTVNRALAGRDAGKTDAITARGAAVALGFPATQPIYLAVDFNATSAQYPAIDLYLGGAESVFGLAGVGVYGHANLMEHCATAKTAAWFWQTYAWSGGVVSTAAHLLQYSNGQTINGGAVDLCRSLRVDFGQWPLIAPDTSTGAAMTIPVSMSGPFDIALTVGDQLFDQNFQPAAKCTLAQTVRGYFTTGTGFYSISAIITADQKPQMLFVKIADVTGTTPVPAADAVKATVALYEGRLAGIKAKTAAFAADVAGD